MRRALKYGAINNAEIETAYNAQVAVVSQTDAEAGTSTSVRRWTAQRVSQAIAALARVADQIFTGAIIKPRHAIGSQDTTVTWSWSSGKHGFTATLTGNAAIAAPTNAPTLSAGQYTEFLLTITQDGTGTRVPTWNAVFKNTPTLSTAASAIDHIAGVFDGTNYILGAKVTQ